MYFSKMTCFCILCQADAENVYMCCMKRYAHLTQLFHPQPEYIGLHWSNHPSIHALNPHQLACTWLRPLNKILHQYVSRQIFLYNMYQTE